MNIAEVIQQGLAALDNPDAAPNPKRLLRQLLAHFMDLPESTILAFPEREVSTLQAVRFHEAVNAFRLGCPPAYLFGVVPFLDWDFFIDRRALIPRPETEYLCRMVFDDYKQKSPPADILDFCCGSGVMGLSAALQFPEAKVTLTDISSEALDLTRENAEKHDLLTRVTLAQGDLWYALGGEATRFDLILCNPPYVAETDEVQNSVLDYEPHSALFSDDDGLAHVKRILGSLDRFLTPAGLAVFELGHEHRKPLDEWMLGRGLKGKTSWRQDPFKVTRFLFYETE